MLTFPLKITWEEIARLEGCADDFSWDESCAEEEEPNLASRVLHYTEVFSSSKKLEDYLAAVGYKLWEPECDPPFNTLLEPLGLCIETENALRLACALFGQVMLEYDDGALEPTWELFGLGGDDDVDYCGTQPSCVCETLLRAVE